MSEVATLVNRGDPASRVAEAGLDMTGATRYRVCDLLVESSVPLPELSQVEGGSPDCRFEVLPAAEGFAEDAHWFHQWITADKETWLKLADRGEDYLLRFLDQGDFLISRDGRDVRCCPLPGTPESTIRHLFLDQAVPLVLSLWESLVLHASAILTPQGVIAFVGKSGQGKSTLAACFGQSGFRLISDDYLVLRKMALRKMVEDWFAIPSYPGVRLWPEASDGIFSVPPESAEIAHYTDKRRVSDPALVPFAEGPSALRCLYFLNDQGDAFLPEPSILPLRPREAFMKLVSCAFSLDVRDKVRLERQFEAIGQITAQLPCFQLEYARDFAMLPAVRRMIVDQPVRSGL
ncbi:MAG: hypothetical protein LAO18_05905 [Acidobacteriia bacterium]|nr:hypothetical protein [Terriglobia bacterium]